MPVGPSSRPGRPKNRARHRDAATVAWACGLPAAGAAAGGGAAYFSKGSVHVAVVSVVVVIEPVVVSVVVVSVVVVVVEEQGFCRCCCRVTPSSQPSRATRASRRRLRTSAYLESVRALAKDIALHSLLSKLQDGQICPAQIAQIRERLGRIWPSPYVGQWVIRYSCTALP